MCQRCDGAAVPAAASRLDREVRRESFCFVRCVSDGAYEAPCDDGLHELRGLLLSCRTS